MEENILQSELANFLKIPRNTYSNYERGIRQPNFEILINIIYNKYFQYN